MELDHLSLFKDIVSRRSVSLGAKEHGVTQSAASQVVQEFERAFDVQLLDRSRRPLEITPAGQLFFDFAHDVLERQARLLAELDDLRAEPSGVVRIASIYSIGLSEMARLETAFHKKMPRGHLEVHYLRPEKVYGAVLDDKADLGLVSYPEARRDVEILPWRREPMVLAAAPTHPLANHVRVRATELNEQEFIGFDEDLPVSRHVEGYLKDAGVQVRCRLRFDNIQSMKEALLGGTAVAILPAPMLRTEVADGRLRAVRLVPAIDRPLGIVHRKRHLPAAVRMFLDVVRPTAARPLRSRSANGG